MPKSLGLSPQWKSKFIELIDEIQSLISGKEKDSIQYESEKMIFRNSIKGMEMPAPDKEKMEEVLVQVKDKLVALNEENDNLRKDLVQYQVLGSWDSIQA